MIDRLNEIEKYNYYFQFTLNSYSKDFEQNVPNKTKEVINTFTELSERVGSKKVIWRYDPIILNEKYTLEYHTKNFEKIAQLLDGKFNRCVISFVDYYKKNASNFRENNISELTNENIIKIAECFSQIAQKHKFNIYTCAEQIDLSMFEIKHGKCIDDKIIEMLIGQSLKIKKDSNQREECGCVESIDIGLYNTCMHGCKYCYANYSHKIVETNFANYDKSSPILCSILTNEDKVTERKVESIINTQLQLW